MGMAYSTNKEKRNSYRMLVRKPEGPLGRQRRRRLYNIKMDLREIGWYGMDRIDLTQHTEHFRAVFNTVMNFRVP
jgi:hypothetical protein